MNRWKMRAVGVLAVIALATAGCQNQGDDVESPDGLPSVDQSMPTESDGGMEMSPSMEASPSGS
jgi:hypothetical protein